MYWAGPGSKALAWAGLCQAWAHQNVKPSPFSGLGLGPGLGLVKLVKDKGTELTEVLMSERVHQKSWCCTKQCSSITHAACLAQH
jgi:hypothetical protein